ncbi:MAG: hypothetical protein N2504_06435 [candidate division WOR-3 bacterium]|nr:hypothetical protein [candidate division WOR-3 bacterium]MCX7948206.1 hypothetical protein [candidate division WOR-3 bacterium]MDW8150008.1 hypothetical protein [candidate division WOR-3 bacterium]
MSINGVLGLSLIVMDLSIKIVLNLNEMDSYPDFGLFYVGIINLFFYLVKDQFEKSSSTIISILLILSVIYPISSILKNFLGYSILKNLEAGGLWSLCMAIIMMILSKFKI